jgi:hypothetical protein
MGALRLFFLIRLEGHMKGFAVRFLVVSCLAVLRLQAQSRNTDCDGTPPAHWLDRNGNVFPEYWEWDPANAPRRHPRTRPPRRRSRPSPWPTSRPKKPAKNTPGNAGLRARP